ncbi:unnamed protein product [Lepidochelys kempii]
MVIKQLESFHHPFTSAADPPPQEVTGAHQTCGNIPAVSWTQREALGDTSAAWPFQLQHQRWMDLDMGGPPIKEDSRRSAAQIKDQGEHCLLPHTEQLWVQGAVNEQERNSYHHRCMVLIYASC